MSSFDKVVKLACKPKAAPPKSKYLDPIIAATWSEDGAVHDVCRALIPRLKEPNAIVVFKALLVLHTMIRNGSTDNVLSYLSSEEVLRLRNVSGGNWEGYAAPENLQNYATYLDARIRAYRQLKHDAIRVQAESNRDMRNSASVEEDRQQRWGGGGGSTSSRSNAASGPVRSKTITGRKLRVMTVEKGLLRETKAVHKMIDALVECRFYLDDLEDELTTTALRMLVKDLLILFQAGNEGVINVLEHYFEMSQVDAKEALTIYRHFCKQTERVVEYLGVAKKLQNLLNVPIPNLKHAPVSLAGALQEYLDDPNFEQNRIEYKANKAAAERSSKSGSKAKGSDSASKPAVPPVPALPTASASVPAVSVSSTNGKSDIVDFFAAIEEEQPSMFNPQTNSPSQAYFQQQATVNPFVQRQMVSGQPFSVQAQPTGFMAPQATGFPGGQANPFSLQAPQQTGHRPFSSFLPSQPTGFNPSQSNQQMSTGLMQPQPTGFNGAYQQVPQQQQQGFLQPQQTGFNPFRQSVLVPQSTGMALFGVGANGAPPGSGGLNGSTTFNQHQPSPNQPFAPTGASGTFTAPTASPWGGNHNTAMTGSNIPARPASTPLTSLGTSTTSPPIAKPVKTHQTGTNNPFGRAPSPPPPPVPRQPTLMELAMGIGGSQNNLGSNSLATNGQHQTDAMPQQTSAPNSTSSFGFNSGALSAGGTDMSSVASSFSFAKTHQTGTAGQFSPSGTGFASSPVYAQNTSTTTNTTLSDSLFSLPSVSSNPTGGASLNSATSPPIKPQTTGFAGIKPFKPSSSFGASLLDSLPPIPGSTPGTPAVSPGAGVGGGIGGADSRPSFGLQTGATPLGTQPTGLQSSFGGSSMLGSGLRPQMTGGGVANPFRASMAGGNTGFGSPSFGENVPPVPSLGGFNGTAGSHAPFGSMMFNHGAPSSNAPQKQQDGSASLI